MKTDSLILQAGSRSQQIVGMLAGLQLCRIEDDRISVGDTQLGANLPALLVRQSRVSCKAGVVDRIGHAKDAVFGYAHRPVKRCVCRTDGKDSAYGPIKRTHKWL